MPRQTLPYYVSSYWKTVIFISWSRCSLFISSEATSADRICAVNNNNNNSNNNRISIAPYGRNFRGAGGRSDQCSMKQGLKYCAVIHNMCSDNLRLCSNKGLFVQWQKLQELVATKNTINLPKCSHCISMFLLSRHYKLDGGSDRQQWRRQLVGTWSRAPPRRLREFFSLYVEQVVWFGLVLCQTLTQQYLFSCISFGMTP